MPTIGLTGNYGMGKTTVLELFGKMGAYTFSADKFVHDALCKREITRKIAALLGNHVLTIKSDSVSINKDRVAKIIFDDPRKRKAVEQVIHPCVLKRIKSTGGRILKKEPSAIIIFEVPLLFEAGYGKYFDKVIAVYCKRDIAFKRLREKGVSKEQACLRLRAQMPITKKIKLADFTINNSNGIDKTERSVRSIHNKLERA